MHVKSKIPEDTLQVLEDAKKFSLPASELDGSARSFINPLGENTQDAANNNRHTTPPQKSPVNYNFVILFMIMLLLGVNGALLAVPYIKDMMATNGPSERERATKNIEKPISESTDKDLLSIINEQ